ncbi:Acriflavine sensitivity control protein acr-2 [Pleurostoma richardsiae]|uniref:Acriflavine sensitivity control protein acr-2 n=1 Tax=Pleurostoma richardsiae TaxID=41990 RepID=A0AA38VXW1_9PEZI|nr:Acriflavine sensitivity control protein acr-2 [Pleurostoma richardsiae]
MTPSRDSPPASAETAPLKKCHNCRRRRLRCDRSFPTCHKCSQNGEQCLGYGKLFRWAQDMPTRGKTAHFPPSKSSAGLAVRRLSSSNPEPGFLNVSWEEACPQIPRFVLEPVLQDLSPNCRHYITHFERTLCKDLVSYDRVESNPFRSIIPLIQRFDYLREIILATSAVHLATLRRSRGQLTSPELVDALTSKQRAISLIRTALSEELDSFRRHTILIAIVFFVNFDLIDSGRGGWKAHIEAAGALIQALHDSHSPWSGPLTAVTDMVVADCIAFHILGSTISSRDAATASGFDKLDVLSILRKVEMYSYHGCPPEILEIILSATRISANTVRNGKDDDSSINPEDLIQRARSFDVYAWAKKIHDVAPFDDLATRTRLASAHRASACLYIMLAFSGPEHIRSSQAEDLVSESLLHLCSVPVSHPLFKGTAWPTFMAGAQTDDPASRELCSSRLRALYHATPFICPWGYVETAILMLQAVWDARDAEISKGQPGTNWLVQLKSWQFNCLIV